MGLACTSDGGEAKCDYRAFQTEPFLNTGVFRMRTMDDGALYFTVMTGTLLAPTHEVYRIDREAHAMCLTCAIAGSQRFADPSPDQKWLIVQSGSPEAAEGNLLGELGATQLHALNLETFRLDQLTFEGVNRIPWWAPDGRTVYWTRLDPDLTFHMVEGTFGVEEGLPVLRVTREMEPDWPPDPTPARTLGRRYAWYEAKGVLDGDLIFAGTLGASGNGDIWRMDRASRRVTRLTSHPEYDELVQWAPNGRQLTFASSRGQFQMRRFMPFSAGPPLIDGVMTIPLLMYVIKLQVVPLYFQAWLMNADGSDPVRVFTEEEESGWLYGWVSWAPDSTQFLLTQHALGGRLETLLAPVRTRTMRVLYDCAGATSDWTALKYLPEFDPRRASAPSVTLGLVQPTMLPEAILHENVGGAVSGMAGLDGRVDLGLPAVDVAATYDRFSDDTGASPVTGRIEVRLSSGKAFDDYAASLAVSLAREDDAHFETKIESKGLEVKGTVEWAVEGDAGRQTVDFP
ncbi:MAG: PD40 domain-containing protein [Nitrospirae bacterium]|nr:PD40 domain-containing protein [Nitrospirota bacterium]